MLFLQEGYLAPIYPQRKSNMHSEKAIADILEMQLEWRNDDGSLNLWLKQSIVEVQIVSMPDVALAIVTSRKAKMLVPHTVKRGCGADMQGHHCPLVVRVGRIVQVAPYTCSDVNSGHTSPFR
jgi:hypothetical protein